MFSGDATDVFVPVILASGVAMANGAENAVSSPVEKPPTERMSIRPQVDSELRVSPLPTREPTASIGHHRPAARRHAALATRRVTPWQCASAL